MQYSWPSSIMAPINEIEALRLMQNPLFYLLDRVARL
jgi:hypothetical protein